jgi:AraC-like DNA-binding protein
VILLTAKAEREDKLEGLQIGADDYLMKPFDATELRIRIKNLIAQRKRLHKYFGKDFSFNPEEVSIGSVDEIFLGNVKTIVEDFLDDETFGVENLSRAVGMSRSQLHRKLKAMTNQSPNQIIRTMRLVRAKELLEKKAGNASEIAFMVGFNSLAYFSKCYKDHFGVSPSEVIGN